MRSHVTESRMLLESRHRISFNTASGMRSHVTLRFTIEDGARWNSFNTASGMRSHVTTLRILQRISILLFQYRKRYEITCDGKEGKEVAFFTLFQYRKRYEITCDVTADCGQVTADCGVSIPQAV